MRTLQNQMLRICDEARLCTRIAAPEQKDHRLLALVQVHDDRIGELLPAHAVMRIRLSVADGQCRIEQQHTLLCPAGQVAGAAAVVDP